jgi:hypothetical protein
MIKTSGVHLALDRITRMPTMRWQPMASSPEVRSTERPFALAAGLSLVGVDVAHSW